MIKDEIYLVTDYPDVFFKMQNEDGGIHAYAVQSYCCFEHTLLNGKASDFTCYQTYENEFFKNKVEITKEEYDRIRKEAIELKYLYSNIV